MSWTNRSRARAGNALTTLLFFMAALFGGDPVRAQTVPNLWFGGTRLILERALERGNDFAVATDDPGLERFLRRVGASIAYEPGQRYIVVTSADRRTITFTLGETRYAVVNTGQSAGFAPYASGRQAYIPFFALARALYVDPVALGAETVLQPQLGALEVRTEGKITYVTLRAATPVAFRRLSGAPGERVSLALSGVASALDQSRLIGTPGLGEISLVVNGPPKNPTTTITFEAPASGSHVMLTSSSANELRLAFAAQDAIAGGQPIPPRQGATAAAAAVPVPLPPTVVVVRPPRPEPSGQPAGSEYQPVGPPDNPPPAAPEVTPPAGAIVQSVDVATAEEGLNLKIAVRGNAAYEWHRLPDNRWYVDIKGTTLATSPRDESPNQRGVSAIRVRQFSPDVVRVSLTLTSSRRVEIAPYDGGLNVGVGVLDDLEPQRVGVGQIGGGPPMVGLVTPAPLGPKGLGEQPRPGATGNGRLIVIDPGHGGSDPGAMRFGLVEKMLTLDIAQRLRSALTARGWVVRMTRDRDTDVFGPNASMHDELQARCDVANQNGARMFVSIHINSFGTTALNGTTTYFYKKVDRGLAQAVHRRLIPALGTKDDGIRRDNYYVVNHTTMPAILVETAFLSNPSDADLLRSPEFLQKVALAVADGIGDYAASPATTLTSAEQ